MNKKKVGGIAAGALVLAGGMYSLVPSFSPETDLSRSLGSQDKRWEAVFTPKITDGTHTIAVSEIVGDGDARLSDARTPTPHATTHGQGGSDAISPASIGAMPFAPANGSTYLASGDKWVTYIEPEAASGGVVAVNGKDGVVTLDLADLPGVAAALAAKVDAATSIETVAPLSGGGSLAASRALSIGAASTSAKGVVQLSNSVNSTSERLAATPKAVKAVYDIAMAKASLISPAFTGAPTVPTAPVGTSTMQAASTEFVSSAVASQAKVKSVLITSSQAWTAPKSTTYEFWVTGGGGGGGASSGGGGGATILYRRWVDAGTPLSISIGAGGRRGSGGGGGGGTTVSYSGTSLTAGGGGGGGFRGGGGGGGGKSGTGGNGRADDGSGHGGGHGGGAGGGYGGDSVAGTYASGGTDGGDGMGSTGGGSYYASHNGGWVIGYGKQGTTLNVHGTDAKYGFGGQFAENGVQGCVVIFYY